MLFAWHTATPTTLHSAEGATKLSRRTVCSMLERVTQVGLNWTAIGIEHAGFMDSDVLGDRRQMAASLRLTAWLRCRYGIKLKDVIGHNESLSSPYHRERVARLRNQTHGDMTHASMQVYRRRLRAFKCG